MRKAAQKRFFNCLSDIIGNEYIIIKPNKDDFFLSKLYDKSLLPTEIKNIYIKMLDNFNCSYNDIRKMSQLSLSHHIDGIINKHPILGSRIIEFDEEQHFTKYRKKNILMFKNILNLDFHKDYIKIYDDYKFLVKVKKKHVQQGYRKKTKGFSFRNGRMAQRAYYDALRDTAHLSNYNQKRYVDLKPIIRFSKYEFEKKFHINNFLNISIENIKEYIKIKLSI